MSLIGLMPRRVFYGWYIVAAVLVITTVFSGLIFYNLSVLLAAFVSERGFPVGLASSATATFFVASGAGGFMAGRLVDRVDPRLLISGGAMVGAAALASVGLLSEVWHLYAFHMALGFAYGTCGLVPVTTVIARWFNVQRSLAFSIGSTGLSLGGILVSPVVALGIAQHGLAATAPWMALGLIVGIVPVALLVLRASPQAMGLAPDGLTRAQAAAAPPQPFTLFPDAVRSGYFYAVSVAYLFLLGSQVGGMAHVYNLARTRDSTETAALAIAAMASSSTVGRLVGGALLVRVRSHTFALALMAMQAAAFVLLAWAHGRAAIVSGVILLGVTTGNSLMMHPLLLVERFGTRDYGRIYSASQMMTVAGLAACPALVGLTYEAGGGYALPFLASAVVTLAGLAVLAAWGGQRGK